MKLDDSIPIYLAHVAAENEEGTLEAYTLRLEKFRQFIGRRKVSRTIVLEWIRHLLTVERLSKRTVAHYRRTVRGFYAYLVENEFEKVNPVSKGSRINPSSAPKEAFDDEEYLRLLNAAADTEFWDYAIRLGYDTGLRLSDVAELEWSSVNFATRSVKLMPRKTKRYEKVVEIPLTESTMHVLEKMKLAAGGSQFVAPWMAAQFAADRHKTLSMQFIRLARKAHVFKSYHSFRHTFVTRMLAANVHPAIIASMTGQSLGQIMTYSHPSLETKRAAMAHAVNL